MGTPVPEPAAGYVPTAQREDLLSVAAAAKRLGMSKQWIYDHANRFEPKLTCVRFGSAVKFRPSDLDRFIAEHVNAPRKRKRRTLQ